MHINSKRLIMMDDRRRGFLPVRLGFSDRCLGGLELSLGCRAHWASRVCPEIEFAGQAFCLKRDM